MIAEVLHAEWRESANGKPYLKMRMDVDGEVRFMYMAPQAIAGWNSLMRQCYLPTHDTPTDDYNFKPKDIVGKLLSVSVKLVHFRDIHYWGVFLNIDWSKVPLEFK